MKRFWKEASVQPAGSGWQVALDGRAVKTVGRKPQVLPSEALAEALAAEWAAQGETIDPSAFPMRDLADVALDVVAPDRATSVAKLLTYAETDTLCYRADPDEPLAARQRAMWEPLVKAAELRHSASFTRVAGVIHRPQPEPTLAALRGYIDRLDPFTLAALLTLSSLSASLLIGIAALEPDADIDALWDAANCEEDWQAEQWGWDHDARALRDSRAALFATATRFAVLAGSGQKALD